jgi:VWFA-related protein
MRSTLALLAVAFFAVFTAAQVHEEVTVEVVDVPVYVFHAGKPIANLTKDDFELFVNGKRQQVDYFDRIDFEAAPAAMPATAQASPPVRDPRNRRLFLLWFDLIYNRPAGLALAQKAAVAMVGRALPQDFFAVVTTSTTGAKFVIPFTRDREVIRRAVIKLSPSSAHDALAISITDAERQMASTWQPPDARNGSGHSGEDPVPEIMALAKPELEQRQRSLAQSQGEGMSEIAARLAELEGYKHVIYFSQGFSPYLITGAIPHLGFGQVPEMNSRLWQAVHAMAQSFRASGALLHTVDLALKDSINTDRSADLGVSSIDPMTNDTLYMFAAQTGGQFIHGTNDITGALADLSATSGSGYRLGFKPVNARKGANEIDVKVKGVPAGTSISFRKGFSWPDEPAKDVDSLRLADIIQNDIPQSGTPPAFAFLERPYIDVVVPARQLAKQFGTATDGDVLLYIFDGKGIAVDYREKKFSIPANPTSDIAVREKLSFPPGSYVAKSLLRVGKSVGFAKVGFTIPEGE